jgi:small subunit ribosomal protein S11
VAKEPKDAAGAPEGAAAKSSKRKKEFRKKKEKRIVPHGVVCIQATFNNTIITLTDPDGRAVSWSSAGFRGFQGIAQGYAVRRAASRDDRRRRGSRPIRNEIRGSAREGSGRGTRISRARTGIFGLAHQRDQRRDAGAAQRLPSAEAPSRIARKQIWKFQKRRQSFGKTS